MNHYHQFRMENLSYKDHYKILQEAMMKNRDPDLKIVPKVLAKVPKILHI